MWVADDHVVLFANRHHLGHRVEHDLVFSLARITELLTEVAFADQHGADAGDVFEHVRQIFNPHRVLDLQHHENFAVRRQRPDIGALVIFLLGDTPIARRLHRAVTANSYRFVERLVFQARIAAGSDRVIGLFDGTDMRPDDAVATQIQRLLGEELVLLDAIGRDARGGRDGRCWGS